MKAIVRTKVPKLNKTVRSDSRGLFVITNGGVYRPEHGRWHLPSVFDYQDPPPTFTDGERVFVSHVNQTPTCRVVGADGREARWDLHGDSERFNGTKVVKLPTADAWWSPVHTCGQCGEAWPCTVVNSRGQYRADVVALHSPVAAKS